MLVNGVVETGTETRNLIFCTDDKHTSDILREGHISYNVNRAIELGLDPIQAIQMATLNTAQHFRIDHLIGSQISSSLLPSSRSNRNTSLSAEGSLPKKGDSLPISPE